MDAEATLDLGMQLVEVGSEGALVNRIHSCALGSLRRQRRAEGKVRDASEPTMDSARTARLRVSGLNAAVK